MKKTVTCTYPYCKGSYITKAIIKYMSLDRDYETLAIDYSLKYSEKFRDLGKAEGINTSSRLKGSTMCSQLN